MTERTEPSRLLLAAAAAAIPVLAVLFAYADAAGNAIAAFPTVSLKVGNGVSELHVPALGLALAAAVSLWAARRWRLATWPIVSCAVVAFGITHLLALLAIQWRQGLYALALGGPHTPRIYLSLANVYIVAVLSGAAVAATWFVGMTAADARFVRRFLGIEGVAARVLGGGWLAGIPLVSAAAFTTSRLWPLSAGILVLCGVAWVRKPRLPRPGATTISRARFDAVAASAIAVISFGVRYAWGRHLLSSTGADFIRASDDGTTYDELGRFIAAGAAPPIATATHFGGMLYWYFLGFLYKVFGVGNFSTVILVQSLLGAVVPVAMYFLARRVCKSAWLALAAATICSLNVVLIFLSGVIGMEALFVPLVALALGLLVRNWSAGRAPAAAFLAAGLLLGVANMTRNEIFGYPVMLLLLAVPLARGRDVRMAAVVCAGFAAVWMTQAAITRSLYGQWTLPSQQAPVTFARGTFGIDENVQLDRMGFNPFLDAPKAARVLAAQPRPVVSLLTTGFVKRLYTFLLLPNSGIFDPLALTTSGNINDVLPDRSVNYSSVIEAYELLIGLAGAAALLLDWRGRPMIVATLLGLLVYSCALNAFIDAKSARHRAIVIPILTLCLVKGVEVAMRPRRALLAEG